MYYEYRITSLGEKSNRVSTIKLYLSSAGNARTEMDIPLAATNGKAVSPVVTIGNPDKPNESISIDEDKKTYTVNHINIDSIQYPGKIQSVVTKIGEEKLLGYNCVHARVISNKSLGSFYQTTDTVDIWRSNDIPLQEKFRSLLKRFDSREGSFMYSRDIVGQLKQMGCDGFMMKMQMHDKRFKMTDELVKAEPRDLPASLFQVPAGYKEVKEGF
jgi:hypothetical protein